MIQMPNITLEIESRLESARYWLAFSMEELQHAKVAGDAEAIEYWTEAAWGHQCEIVELEAIQDESKDSKPKNRKEYLACVINYIDSKKPCAVITTATSNFAAYHELQQFFPTYDVMYNFLQIAFDKGWLAIRRHQVGTMYHDVIQVNHSGRLIVGKA